jgi:hypothetical protein
MNPMRIKHILVLLLTAAPFHASIAADEPKAEESVIRGIVTDANGSPLAGVKILINKYEGGPLNPLIPETTTDKKGHFELRIRSGELVLIKEIWVSHPGFVRITKTDRFRLGPKQELSLDFKLQKGDILSGKIDNPFRPGPPEKAQHMFRVTGDGFDQIDVTKPGGEFEIWVPPGVYAIEILGLTKMKEAGIRAGTKDLVIKPRQAEITPEHLAAAFDQMWTAMDHNYSYFAYKADVDWNQLRERHRPRAIAAKTRDEFIDELKTMLTNLKDMHVWIETENGVVATYGKPFQRNWNPQSVMQSWASSKQSGNFAIVGKTRPDGFGFVVVTKQSNATLADVPGFIVDLRGGASGGSEPLAQQLAQAFCAKDVVYAKHRYRNGPAHDTFGAEHERTLPAGAEKPFTKPVVCLIGQRCMSSGEALAKMFKALPHATLVGMRTRGASGNPKPVQLKGLNLSVAYSTWVDMNPDGSLIEGVGIAPHIEINDPVEAYENADPAWDRALVVLREKVVAENQSAK